MLEEVESDPDVMNEDDELGINLLTSRLLCPDVLLVDLLFKHDLVWFVDYHFEILWTYLWNSGLICDMILYYHVLPCVYCTTIKSMCTILFTYSLAYVCHAVNL